MVKPILLWIVRTKFKSVINFEAKMHFSLRSFRRQKWAYFEMTCSHRSYDDMFGPRKTKVRSGTIMVAHLREGQEGSALEGL